MACYQLDLCYYDIFIAYDQFYGGGCALVVNLVPVGVAIEVGVTQYWHLELHIMEKIKQE